MNPSFNMELDTRISSKKINKKRYKDFRGTSLKDDSEYSTLDCERVRNKEIITLSVFQSRILLHIRNQIRFGQD